MFLNRRYQTVIGCQFHQRSKSSFCKRVKRYWQLDWILTLLWATAVKAAHKYVGEIDPRSWQFFSISKMVWGDNFRKIGKHRFYAISYVSLENKYFIGFIFRWRTSGLKIVWTGTTFLLLLKIVGSGNKRVVVWLRWSKPFWISNALV